MLKVCVCVCVCVCFFLNFIYLFMKDRERERGRDTRQREKQAQRRKPDVGLQPRVSRITPQAGGQAKPLRHQGCPDHLLLCNKVNENERERSKIQRIVSRAGALQDSMSGLDLLLHGVSEGSECV